MSITFDERCTYSQATSTPVTDPGWYRRVSHVCNYPFVLIFPLPAGSKERQQVGVPPASWLLRTRPAKVLVA